MVTNFFTPANPVNRYTNQSTFVIERQLGERAFLFAEYVGEYPLVGGPITCSTPAQAIASPRLNKSISTLVLASITMRQHIFSAWAIRSGSMACFEQIHVSVGFLQ